MPDNLVRIDNPEVSIRGTSEMVPVCYPVTARITPSGRAVWSYSGGHMETYDESAHLVTDEETGEICFMDENGDDVPFSNVGVLLEDGTVKPLDGEG